MDGDRSGGIPTYQASHYTTYGRCDAEEMSDRVRVQKFILSNE